MTDILIARAIHGRLSFAILRDAPADWEKAERALCGGLTGVALEPGDGPRMRLGDIAFVARAMPEASLAEIVARWRAIARTVDRLE